jgi:hypothetical protein
MAWAPGYRCHHRAIFGYCVEHWLDRWRWEWKGKHWHAELDLSNLNRPYLVIDESRPIEFIALSYGNGNSDPVWSISLSRESKTGPM